MELVELGLSSALHHDAMPEVVFYLENLFDIRWALHDQPIRENLVTLLLDLEERIGATRDDDLIRAAGEIIEPHVDFDPLRSLLKDALRTRPIEADTRAHTEQRLEHLLTYIRTAGLSIPTEVKLGRLLAYYTWQFGDVFPKRLREIWTFRVRRRGTVVEVEYPEGTYPHIASILSFDFSTIPRA